MLINIKRRTFNQLVAKYHIVEQITVYWMHAMMQNVHCMYWRKKSKEKKYFNESQRWWYWWQLWRSGPKYFMQFVKLAILGRKLQARGLLHKFTYLITLQSVVIVFKSILSKLNFVITSNTIIRFFINEMWCQNIVSEHCLESFQLRW